MHLFLSQHTPFKDNVKQKLFQTWKQELKEFENMRTSRQEHPNRHGNKTFHLVPWVWDITAPYVGENEVVMYV